MTRDKARDISVREFPHRRTPRFRLKPIAHGGGYVDGAWWPQSDDLMAELPDLLEALSVRLGAIDCVLYDEDEWSATPAELASSGRAVKLDRYGDQPPHTVEIVDIEGNRLSLLVVPFCIEPEQAHRIVTSAAAPGDASSVGDLLMISVKERESRINRDAARKRWDSQHGMTLPSKRIAAPPHRHVERDTTMANEDAVFKAFSDFGIGEIPSEAAVSQRMLRRLEDIDDSATPGPTTAAARAALASSVVAHAVVELEHQLIELKKQLAQRK